MRNFEVKKFGFKNERYQMNILENPMQDPESIYIMHTKLNTEISDIISELGESIPLKITRIEITINPDERNVKYYSFDGVENILNSLFNSDIQSINEELSYSTSYLKTYLTENYLYNIPSIKIEVIFFDTFSKDTNNFLSNFLNYELIGLIGNKGLIEIREISHPLKLVHLLNIPMMLGYPQFKKEGIYEKMGFLNYQLNEMNYLLTNTLIKLDNIEKILTPFNQLRMDMVRDKREKEEREKIKRVLLEIALRGDTNIDFESGDIEDIRYIIKQQIEEEDSELPF